MNIARFLEVGDLLAASIDRFLKQAAPASKTVRAYTVTISDLETTGYAASTINLRNFVIPNVPKWALLTRDKNTFDYPFNVLFFEKCLDQVPGAPPNTWTDARSRIVDAVMREFGDLRKPMDGKVSGLRCQESSYTVFADQAALRNGEFWCEIELTYQETARV